MEKNVKVTTIRLTPGDQEILEQLKLLTGLMSSQIIRIALRRFLVSLTPKQ